MNFMQYFVSYKEIFQNNDHIKKEILRLKTYQALIKFLDRKKIEGNYISEIFETFKNYFTSKEFQNIYFLSPFILNENKLVKDMMKLVISSGETNSFNKLFNEIKEEVNEISTSKISVTENYIKVNTADEYLQKYYENPNNYYYLNNPQEEYILDSNLLNGLANNNLQLSVLYLIREEEKAKNLEDIKFLIKIAKNLLTRFPNNNLLDKAIAKLYQNHFYNLKDKEENIFNYYLKAADSDSEAMYYVGMAYLTGNGIHKDYNLALKYLTKSAQLNNINAYGGLGIYYLVNNNKEEAKKWLEKSASQNDYKALLLLDTDFN